MRFRFSEKTRRAGFTVLFGLAGGAVAVVFLRLTNAVYGAGLGWLARSDDPVRFALGSLATITASSLAAGILLFRFHRGAAGSGIPDLKAAYWNDMGFIPWRAAWVKLVAGVFSLGYEDLSAAMKDGIAWRIALLLLLAKLPATIASYVTGGCGGIFSPTLFMGAMTGFVIAGLAGLIHPVGPGESVLLDATVCPATLSIREAAERMVQSSSGRAVILDPATGAVRAILTLHDVLRAQTRVTEDA